MSSILVAKCNGPYVSHNGTYVSIPKNLDPLKMSFEESVILLHRHHLAEKERHLKQFEEEPELEVLNGRYGPYLCYKGTNYRLPKSMHERARELSLEECMAVINGQAEEETADASSGKKRRYARKK